MPKQRQLGAGSLQTAHTHLEVCLYLQSQGRSLRMEALSQKVLQEMRQVYPSTLSDPNWQTAPITMVFAFLVFHELQDSLGSLLHGDGPCSYSVLIISSLECCNSSLTVFLASAFTSLKPILHITDKSIHDGPLEIHLSLFAVVVQS